MDAQGRVYETDIATVSAEEDGTVVLRFSDGCRLSADNTVAVLQAHLAAAAGAARPTLADVRGLRAATREAREIAAGPEATRVTSRMAILVGNPVTRVLGNLFVSVRRPSYPTRLFNDESEARAWLRGEGS